MLFSQAEVDYKDFLEILAEHEVTSLDISMNKSSIMDLFDSFKHFYEELNSYLQTVMLLQILPNLSQIVTKQIHHNKILLTVLHKVIDIAHMLQSLEVNKDVILKNQNTFVLVLLLHLQRHVFLESVVIGLIDETESTLAEFLFQVKAFGNFQSFLNLRHVR